jgi:hypothetical protein
METLLAKDKVSNWVNTNYKKLVNAANRNSNYADYAEDMLGIVVKDVYRQLEQPKYQEKYSKAVDDGTILGIFIGALRNQIHSNTSEGYRSIRRGLEEVHNIGYLDYSDSGSTIEEKEEFEDKLLMVNSYLHYFYPVDVYILKEVLFNNKSYKEISEEYGITINYVHRTVNYIKTGLKMYVELKDKKQFDIYSSACDLWEQLHTRQISSIGINHKQQMFCFYNRLQNNEIADNIYNKDLFKRVFKWFKETIILD